MGEAGPGTPESRTEPYRNTTARPRVPTVMSARPSPLMSNPPATDMPKYWSPGATAEALIRCGGRNTRRGVREGREMEQGALSCSVPTSTAGAIQPQGAPSLEPGKRGQAFPEEVAFGWSLKVQVGLDRGE